MAKKSHYENYSTVKIATAVKIAIIFVSIVSIFFFAHKKNSLFSH